MFRRLALLRCALLSPEPFTPATRAADKTLKVVIHADLKVIDPAWTTIYITNRYGYVVYGTLFGINAKAEPRPRMADRWTVSEDQLT